MGLEHTSVPRWSAPATDVDHTGRSFAIISFSDECGPVVERWQRELAERPVWTWHGPFAEGEALAALRAQVAGASVGWRLLIAGPEHDVLRVRAEAVRAGVLDAEITVAVTQARRRRVWCAHCGTDTEADVEVGARTTCAGCGRPLLVYHHVSRRHAAYLGFQADAEELP